MSCFDCKIGVAGERRTKQRRPIFVVGSAVSVQGSKSVVVEDLSLDGARVRGRDLPARGKQVLIWMEGLDVLGSVAWSKFNESGIVFDRTLDACELTCLEEQAVGTVFSFS